MAKKRQGPPQKGPGKYYRIGMSLMECFQRFPDNATAEQWFVETRWPSGVQCPACASDNVQARPTRKPQPYRCRSCRTDFSAKTGTLMQGSNLGFQTWDRALPADHGIEGNLQRSSIDDLGVTQKTAWHLAIASARPGPRTLPGSTGRWNWTKPTKGNQEDHGVFGLNFTG